MSRFIHRSAWKVISQKFGLRGFSGVASKRLIYPRTWRKSPQKMAGQRKGGRRMDREPVVVQENAREWETWPEEEVAKKGLTYWKTLVSADVTHRTHSEALTMGIAKVPPNEALREHRHLQEEIYLVLEGTGSVTIDGKTRPVLAGTSVFIPGNALHSCENTGEGELRFAYVFPADSFEEVEYVFDE
jgi:quercetin dioxygenase-like cupin family protein